eukprot:TRINITY_DN389_c0_g1_i18.p1 TRINITY_DN389_c0_g1~~TRINITY_DN389_c0_g1_i18.p1  ORF type:complete len:400 (+),score=40.82 TRINITY_DN389_c0_g1_i18:731-1930(+)
MFRDVVSEFVKSFGKWQLDQMKTLHDQPVTNRATDSCHSAETGHMLLLQEAVENMNRLRSQHIFLLAMEKNYLIQKMSFFRDFYLLGLGELFFGFISQISTETKQHSLQSTFLNKCFLEAAKKTSSVMSVSSATYFLENVSNVRLLHDQKSMFYGASPSGEVSWGGIQIKYQIDGLLSFFVSEKDLSVLNELFDLLLTLRRAEFCLNAIHWSKFKPILKQFAVLQRGISEKETRSKLNTVDIQQIDKYLRFVNYMRTRLLFLIESILSYLMLDVVDSEWKVMNQKFAKWQANDENNATVFQEIFDTQQQFVNQLANLSCVRLLPFTRFLNHLFSFVFYFVADVSHVNQALSERLELVIAVDPWITKTSLEFRKQETLLLAIITSPGSSALKKLFLLLKL